MDVSVAAGSELQHAESQRKELFSKTCLFQRIQWSKHRTKRSFPQFSVISYSQQTTGTLFDLIYHQQSNIWVSPHKNLLGSIWEWITSRVSLWVVKFASGCCMSGQNHHMWNTASFQTDPVPDKPEAAPMIRLACQYIWRRWNSINISSFFGGENQWRDCL